MTTKKLEIILNDSRGVHIPADFFKHYNLNLWGLDPVDYQALQSPDNPDYWETWNNLLDSARFVDEQGFAWRLHHGGDLWMLREDLTEDEYNEHFA